MEQDSAPPVSAWPSRVERAFSYYRRLNRVRRHLEGNIEGTLSLTEAAGIAGLNQSYFSTYFHRKTGICFRSWVAGVRVRHAAKLLGSCDSSITEIAYQSGFRDLRTFERAFKREMHCTAREYRKLVRPGDLNSRSDA